MKILIISDSHDNVINLEKVLKWAQASKVSAIIHAGDLSAPGILKNTLAPEFTRDIYLINGNVADKELLPKVSAGFAHVHYLGDEGEVLLEGKKIFLTHFPERAQAVGAAGVYDLVIFGHTHQAELSRSGKTKLINPGTVGGLYNVASFAVYDTKENSVEIFQLDKI